MGRIKILSEDLSNKIAAGEVVERPASVVKELVENAIDAGSHRIFVTVVEGGMRLIQVVDDGEGMMRDEMSLAFQRHATSKIFNEHDLARIMTLGFRGEALPSIASVAKVSLVSKRSGDAEGTEINIEGGIVQSVKTVGCPGGSRFEVRDLFFNVPARRKFIKTQQTEMSHITRVLFNLALSHSDIHFRLTHGSRSLFDVPPCTSFTERADQLLGEGPVGGAMEIPGEMADGFSTERGLSLKGLVSRPPLKRNFKKEQYLFVNLRAVKSALLTHAVLAAYDSFLMKGEEPFFILFLTIDPAVVDVNVHPAKREVRFQNTARVHQDIRNIIREGLLSSGVGHIENRPDTLASSLPIKDNFSPRSAGDRRSAKSWAGWPLSSPENQTGTFREENGAYRTKEQGVGSSFSPDSLFKQSAESLGAPGASEIAGHVPLIRPLGQVFGTFLLAEIDGDLAIIDQHTAHERILYEAFLDAWKRTGLSEEMNLEVQPLLIPQQIELTLPKSAVLKDYLADLEAIGCKIETFGETTFLVRELPALIAKMDVIPFINELTDELIELGVTSKMDQAIRTIMASMACHGAVRANQSMSTPEIKALLQTYYEKNIPPSCPHGRPIVIRYTPLELEKLFRRK